VHARVLELVPGPSGKADADWLKDRGTGFTAGIKTAALAPFRGYSNAIRDELHEAITLLDPFHVVKLGSAMDDEVPAGSNRTPLATGAVRAVRPYGIRRTLQIGAEHLTGKQAARLDAELAPGTPITKSP
jgi:transposase